MYLLPIKRQQIAKRIVQTSSAATPNQHVSNDSSDGSSITISSSNSNLTIEYYKRQLKHAKTRDTNEWRRVWRETSTNKHSDDDDDDNNDDRNEPIGRSNRWRCSWQQALHREAQKADRFDRLHRRAEGKDPQVPRLARADRRAQRRGVECRGRARLRQWRRRSKVSTSQARHCYGQKGELNHIKQNKIS